MSLQCLWKNMEILSWFQVEYAVHQLMLVILLYCFFMFLLHDLDMVKIHRLTVWMGQLLFRHSLIAWHRNWYRVDYRRSNTTGWSCMPRWSTPYWVKGGAKIGINITKASAQLSMLVKYWSSLKTAILEVLLWTRYNFPRDSQLVKTDTSGHLLPFGCQHKTHGQCCHWGQSR